MYSLDNALALLDETLAPKRLSSVQELVFRQSWLGKSYRDMARDADYDADYLRVVGGQLWQALSPTLGEKITKKNICAVMRHHAQQALPSNPSIHMLTEGAVKQNSMEKPRTSVSLNSQFYIERQPMEQYALAELTKPGALLKIQGAHLMGKTSLMTRLLAHAESCDYVCARLNFLQADRVDLAHPEKFLRWFCANLSWQIQGEVKLDEFWNNSLGCKVNCTLYVQEHLLKPLQSSCAIALDEMDCLFEYPETALEFLPLLHIWHKNASDGSVWQKLRLVVAYKSDQPHLFRFQSPLLNIGTTLQLEDLTLKQLQKLADDHGLGEFLDQSNTFSLERLHNLIGGHPYLARLVFSALCKDLTGWDRLFQEMLSPKGMFGAHLHNYLLVLQQQPDLATAFRTVITANEPVQLDAMTAEHLHSLGLVRQESMGVTPYCELYRLYFGDWLSQKCWPDGQEGAATG